MPQSIELQSISLLQKTGLQFCSFLKKLLLIIHFFSSDSFIFNKLKPGEENLRLVLVLVGDHQLSFASRFINILLVSLFLCSGLRLLKARWRWSKGASRPSGHIFIFLVLKKAEDCFSCQNRLQSSWICFKKRDSPHWNVSILFL